MISFKPGDVVRHSRDDDVGMVLRLDHKTGEMWIRWAADGCVVNHLITSVHVELLARANPQDPR